MLFAARSAVALYRLLDAAPAFAGDDRISRLFTLVPGSEFGVGALSVIDAIGGRAIPWSEALTRSYDLVVAASPKGELSLLRGRHVLLPHGAGFNKALPGEGSADSASGLDPAYLLRPEGTAPIALHALAHPDQIARLAAADPGHARSAKVVGDPTLDRVLASRPLRDHYRAALGTGPRTLLALASTWGPRSLIRRYPDLPARLAAHLPYDAYQLALIVHPNEHSALGAYELAERLAPALDAGLVLAEPREEWASVLLAADALVTDHGSAALYFAAARDRPVVGVGRENAELIPGSPMHTLLRRVPELGAAEAVEEALAAYRPGSGQAAVRAAFAHRGTAVERLRAQLYELIGLTPPSLAVAPRPLPEPAPARREPTAFDVHAECAADGVRLARRPAGTGPAGHHLAAEHGAAGEHFTRSAGLLYRRPHPRPRLSAYVSWSADGWARQILSEYPGCRSAAAVLPSGRCLLRVRGRPRPYTVLIEPRREAGRILHADPAAALSAAHAWLLAHPQAPSGPIRLTCRIGEQPYAVTVRTATHAEAAEPVEATHRGAAEPGGFFPRSRPFP